MRANEYQAGTELDEAVSRRLFPGHAHSQPPPFSVDLSYAWIILERLVEMGWSVDVMSAIDLVGDGSKWRVRLSDDEPTIADGVAHVTRSRGPCTESAPTPALAICRAVLRATEPVGPVSDGDLILEDFQALNVGSREDSVVIFDDDGEI